MALNIIYYSVVSLIIGVLLDVYTSMPIIVITFISIGLGIALGWFIKRVPQLLEVIFEALD